MSSELIKQSAALQQADLIEEAAYLKGEQKIAEAETAQQAETAESLSAIFQEAENPAVALYRKQEKSITDRGNIRVSKAQEAKEEGKTLPPAQIKEKSDQFERENPELKSTVLQQLLGEITNCKTKEEILALLEKYYPEPALADQALDFLIATTVGDLQKIVREAKELHTAKYQKQISAGKNIDTAVKEYATAGLSTHKNLRELYRDVTENPRDPIDLYLELSKRFPDVKDQRKIMAFLFHSLGADLKSKGPSIEPGKLHSLMAEVKSLQAGLGAMKFFQGRMRLVNSLFAKEGVPLPKDVTAQAITRTFVTYLKDRYPNSEKAADLTNKLGVRGSPLGKIILLSQMRDGVREISLDRFFRSLEHRNEVFNSILEALENFEDELDELLEGDKDEEDEEKGSKKKGGGSDEGDDSADDTPHQGKVTAVNKEVS